MLEQLLPFSFIHELEWSFRNIDETSLTGTARNGAYANWRGREYCRLLEALMFCSAQNLKHITRASTSWQWKSM